MKGCYHRSSTKWWGAPCAPHARPICSVSLHNYPYTNFLPHRSTMIYIVIQAVLQSAWATCTKEHRTSDHPGNTLPFCKPMHEALMQQPKLLHNLTRRSFSKNSTNSLHNDLLKSTMLFLQKWMAPTQPRFQTAFWDCYNNIDPGKPAAEVSQT